MRFCALILLCIGMATTAFARDAAAPDWVISHKTAGLEYAENSLEGFAASLAMDVQAIEIDVHVVKDGAVVLHHDPVLSNNNCFEKGDTTRLIVAQQTAQYLAALECRNHKVGLEYQILTLDAFLDLYVQSDRSKYLLLEIKVWDELIQNNPVHEGLDVTQMHYDDAYVAARVYDVLRRYPEVQKVQFNTFGRDLLLELRALKTPEEPFDFGLLYKGSYAPVMMAPLAWITGNSCYDFCWRPNYAEVRGWLDQNDISIFIPNHLQIDSALFARSFRRHIMDNKQGLTVYPWTLNTPSAWEAYLEYPYDGILTDVPTAYLEWITS